MPYTTHWEEKGLYWNYTGEVSDQELLDSYSSLYDNPRYLNVEYEIVNYSGVTKFNVSSDTIFKLGQMDKIVSQKNPHLKIATIATSQLFKGITRMWELSGGNSVWESKLFEDEASAREWLDL